MSLLIDRIFSVEHSRQIPILCFQTRSLTTVNLDAASEELLQVLTQVQGQHPVRVIMELSSVEEIDELAVAMVKAFSDGIEQLAGQLVICRVHAGVLAALRRSGMVCRYTRTRGEAVWSF